MHLLPSRKECPPHNIMTGCCFGAHLGLAPLLNMFSSFCCLAAVLQPVASTLLMLLLLLLLMLQFGKQIWILCSLQIWTPGLFCPSRCLLLCHATTKPIAAEPTLQKLG